MIYFVRHAESVYDPHVPDLERGLSAKGHKQAEALIATLMPLGIERIYASPAKRAIDTIAPFANAVGLAIEMIPAFKECKMVHCKSFEEWKEYIEKGWQDFAFKPPGWESNGECQSRVCKKIEELVKKDAAKTVAISSHGRAISLFLHKLTEGAWGFNEWESLPMPAVIQVCVKTGSIVRI